MVKPDQSSLTRLKSLPCIWGISGMISVAIALVIKIGAIKRGNQSAGRPESILNSLS